MVQTLQIERLFGRFNYLIDLSKNEVTIITGPNGYGKSTILRIINALSHGNMNYLFELDFSKITLVFGSGFKTVIKKSSKTLFIDNIQIPDFMGQSNERKPLTWMMRTPAGDLIDKRNGNLVTDEELYLNYLLSERFEHLTMTKSVRDNYAKAKKKVEQIQSNCGNVRFISDQRLIRKQSNRREELQVIDVISGLPDKLKSEIDKVAGEYSQVSSSLDSSYPKRLFATKDGLRDIDEYNSRLEEANKKFKKLNDYNLVDMTPLGDGYYTAELSNALKIYFDDFSAKYEVFEKLILKLDLFTRIINERLSFKTIRISRKSGFEIVDSKNPNKLLNLTQLSSGEKQEIVLFYELIFETMPNLMLLIDEPEISLHITWQKKFLDDLMEVSHLNQTKVIVATHSPQIISNHFDFQIDLGGLYGMELNKG